MTILRSLQDMQWKLWPWNPESLCLFSSVLLPNPLVHWHHSWGPCVSVSCASIPVLLHMPCVQCPPLCGLGDSLGVKHPFQHSLLLRHPQEGCQYFLSARNLYTYVQRPRKSATSYVDLLKIFLKLLIHAMHISVLSNCILLWLLSFFVPSASAFLLCYSSLKFIQNSLIIISSRLAQSLIYINWKCNDYRKF